MRFIVGAFFLSWAASAQTPKIADLELEVVELPPPLTPPGSTGTITFRVTNHGPEIAGDDPFGEGLRIGSPGVVFREGLGLSIYLFNREGDCTAIRGGIVDPAPGQYAKRECILVFPPLLPGESWTCTVEYQVNHFVAELASGNQVTIEWFAYTSNNSNNEDPNPTNDDKRTVFTFLAAVPTLGPAGLTALTLGLLLAFAWVRRSRKSLM